MTTSRFGTLRNTWRRRLRPAAPLLLAGVLAALALVAIPDDERRDEPPSGRALPAAALAAERPPASMPARQRARPRRRRFVDVVDREAAPSRRIAIPAIGVPARVVPLGLEPDGTMETPDNWGDTGWYTIVYAARVRVRAGA